MAHAPWSTATVEQQHGSCAVIHRFHPEYSMEMLVVRAGLLHFRKLLVSEDKATAVIGRVEL
eukprot:5126134-Lingulodinium_polyedra.AAC.1